MFNFCRIKTLMEKLLNEAFISQNLELEYHIITHCNLLSDSTWCCWSPTTSVEVMVCCLFGNKPLPQPMLTYCQLDPGNQCQWNLSQKMIWKLSVIWKCLQQKVSRFVQCFTWRHRQTSNISSLLVGNKTVDHSDVVGASTVGAAPTSSSFST